MFRVSWICIHARAFEYAIQRKLALVNAIYSVLIAFKTYLSFGCLEVCFLLINYSYVFDK